MMDKNAGLKMQNWKISDESVRLESAGLEFDGLAMGVRVRKTQVIRVAVKTLGPKLKHAYV